jgi:hypothetical protein
MSYSIQTVKLLNQFFLIIRFTLNSEVSLRNLRGRPQPCPLIYKRNTNSTMSIKHSHRFMKLLLSQNSLTTPLRANDEFSSLAHNLIGRFAQSKAPSHDSDVTLTWMQRPILVTILSVRGQWRFECERATRWGFAGAVTIVAVPEIHIWLVTVFDLTRCQALVLYTTSEDKF